MLAADPLRKLFDRATEVLQEFPGNELLVQVCQVAAKISALHTSTPVGKLLMTVQLLLVKAQEWEQYAAKHVSLQVEMAALSMLIGRWRELELKSWGDLLRCKEQSFVQVGYHVYTFVNFQARVVSYFVCISDMHYCGLHLLNK
jgi:midasin